MRRRLGTLNIQPQAVIRKVQALQLLYDLAQLEMLHPSKLQKRFGHKH